MEFSVRSRILGTVRLETESRHDGSSAPILDDALDSATTSIAVPVVATVSHESDAEAANTTVRDPEHRCTKPRGEKSGVRPRGARLRLAALFAAPTTLVASGLVLTAGTVTAAAIAFTSLGATDHEEPGEAPVKSAPIEHADPPLVPADEKAAPVAPTETPEPTLPTEPRSFEAAEPPSSAQDTKFVPKLEEPDTEPKQPPSEAESQPEKQPEPDPEPTPAPDPEPTPAPEPGPTPEPEPGPDPEAGPNTESNMGPMSAPQSVPQAEDFS